MIRRARIQRVLATSIALSFIAIAITAGVVPGPSGSHDAISMRTAWSNRAIGSLAHETRTHVSLSPLLWIVPEGTCEQRLSPAVQAFEIETSAIPLRERNPQLCRAPPLA